jgi:hypothetical protein
MFKVVFFLVAGIHSRNVYPCAFETAFQLMDGCVWDGESQNSIFPQGLNFSESIFLLLSSGQYITIALCIAE